MKQQYAIRTYTLVLVLLSAMAIIACTSFMLIVWLGDEVVKYSIFVLAMASLAVTGFCLIFKKGLSVKVGTTLHLLIGVLAASLLPLIGADPGVSLLTKTFFIPALVWAAFGSLYRGSRFVFVRYNTE